MRTIKWISVLQIIVILSIIFSGCTDKEKKPAPVEANPDYTFTESGEKLAFYTDGVFNFNIITSVQDNTSYELAKTTV